LEHRDRILDDGSSLPLITRARQRSRIAGEFTSIRDNGHRQPRSEGSINNSGGTKNWIPQIGPGHAKSEDSHSAAARRRMAGPFPCSAGFPRFLGAGFV